MAQHTPIDSESPNLQPERRILALFLAIILCISPVFGIPLGVFSLGSSGILGLSAQSATLNVTESGYFGRQLDAEQQSFYNQLLELGSISGGSDNFTLDLNLPLRVPVGDWYYNNNRDNAMINRLHPAIDAMLADYPQISWYFSSVFSYLSLLEDPEPVEGIVTVSTVKLKRVNNNPYIEISALQKFLDDAVTTLLDAVEAPTDYEQLQLLHHALLEQTGYIHSSPDLPAADQVVGPLVGVAVNPEAEDLSKLASTLGFAKSFKLICDELGIPCVTVLGDNTNMWNLVRMEDGKWYAVDVGSDAARNDGETTLLVGADTVIAESSFGDNHRPQGSMCGLGDLEFTYPQLSANPYTPSESQPMIQPMGEITANGKLTYGDILDKLTLNGAFCLTPSPDSPIAGQLAWVTPDAVPTVGTSPMEYLFTPLDSAYGAFRGQVMVEVAPAVLTVTPRAGQTTIYNATTFPDNPLLYDVAGNPVGNDTLENLLTGELALQAKNAGAQLITQGELATTSANYSIHFVDTVTCAVNPRPVELYGADIASKPYDNTVSATVSQFYLTPMPKGDFFDLDYIASFSQKNAGNGIRVNISGIKPHIPIGPDDPYGANHQNYTLNATSYDGATGDIVKRAIPEPSCVIHISPEDLGKNESETLDDILTILAPGTAGRRSYGVATVDNDAFFTSPVTVSFNGLNEHFLHFNPSQELGGGEIGNSSVVSIPMESENFQDTTARITFLYADTVTSKTDVDISLTLDDATYNSKPINPISKVTINVAGETVEPSQVELLYTYSGIGYPKQPTPPTNAGTYQVEVQIDSETYTGTASGSFTIKEAPLTIRPRDKIMTVGGTIPELDFECTGFLGSDDQSLLSPVVLECNADVNKPGAYPIIVANSPISANYSVSSAATGTLTVMDMTMESGYFKASDPTASGWHNADIVITPTVKDGFALVGDSPTGIFQSQLILSQETASGIATLYFQKGTQVTPGVSYAYRLDKTPPVISSVSYAQILNQTAGRLTVAAIDSLSGIASIQVVGPEGSISSLSTDSNSFPIASSGNYTVTVTDLAGNTVSQTHSVAVRGVDGVSIIDANQKPLSGCILELPSSKNLGMTVTGTAMAGDYAASWSSSNPLVAQVDNNGTVVAQSYGRTVITLEVMGKTATLLLEVAQLVIVNQPGDSTSPSVDVPDTSIPENIGAEEVRLMVSNLTAADFDDLNGMAAAYAQFNGMTLYPVGIRLINWSDNSDFSPTGPVTVTLPFPEGSDANYTFAVLHIYDGTSTLVNHAVSDNGIVFQVSALGSFIIGYKPYGTTDRANTSSSRGSTGGSGGRSSQQDTDAQVETSFWNQALLQAQGASSGDTVNIQASRYQTLPANILWAAQGRAVTLRISLDGSKEMVIIGMDLPVLDKAQTGYSKTQLQELVRLIDGEILPRPSLETGETHTVTEDSGNVIVLSTLSHVGNKPKTADQSPLILAETINPTDPVQEIFTSSDEDQALFDIGTGTDLIPAQNSVNNSAPDYKKMLLLPLATIVTAAVAGLMIHERRKKK